MGSGVECGCGKQFRSSFTVRIRDPVHLGRTRNGSYGTVPNTVCSRLLNCPADACHFQPVIDATMGCGASHSRVEPTSDGTGAFVHLRNLRLEKQVT